jgi:hypothetical protein
MWIRFQGQASRELKTERTRSARVFQFAGQYSPGQIDAFLRWFLAGSHNIGLIRFLGKQLEYFPATEFLVKIG